MWKPLVIAAVLLGALATYAPARSRMIDTIEPVLEKLGPVGAFAMRPMHRFTARSEVDFLADQIVLAHTLGKELPREGSFQQWMKLRDLQTRKSGKDPWGSPYYLKRSENRFEVGSAGPDRQPQTEDDIREVVTP